MCLDSIIHVLEPLNFEEVKCVLNTILGAENVTNDMVKMVKEVSEGKLIL